MKSLLLAIILIAASYPNTPVPVCSCRFSENRFERAKAVFYGTLLKRTRIHEKSVVVIKVKVERVFKGNVQETVALNSAYECSYNFRVGDKYLIYAGEQEDSGLETVPCRILSDEFAQKEMKYLEKGEKPKTPPE